MAVLILLMVTSVVATGIPAAANAYFKAVDASHAQVLLSTTMISLRDELATARKVNDVTNSSTISYIDSRGIRSQIEKAADGGIYLIKAKTFLDDETDLVTGNENPNLDNAFKRLLVSEAAATSGMYATCDCFSKSSEGIITIDNLKVVKGSNTVADLGESNTQYKIRIIGVES